MPIHCFSVNPDICAISYGYNVKSKRNGGDERTKGAGIVACWNIKNLEHPERIFQLPSSEGATCCDFSKRNPNLLAVGLFNGNVAVFNVTRKVCIYNCSNNFPFREINDNLGFDAVDRLDGLNRKTPWSGLVGQVGRAGKGHRGPGRSSHFHLARRKGRSMDHPKGIRSPRAP